MSMELMSAPMRDQEKERLEKLRAELDSDRQRFTEAAIKFGCERAVHEVTLLSPPSSKVLYMYYRQSASAFWKKDVPGNSRKCLMISPLLRCLPLS